MTNEKRTIHVGTRMTESEYSDFMVKNMDENGQPLLSKSEFIRTSLVKTSISVNNIETEEYKCFILGKISNNINQIAKRLHEDNIADRINDDTYKKILDELEKLYAEIFMLTQPLRE